MLQYRWDGRSDRPFLALAAVLVILAAGAAALQIGAGGFNTSAYALLLLALAGALAVLRFYRASQRGWETRSAVWFDRALVVGGLAAVLWLFS